MNTNITYRSLVSQVANRTLDQSETAPTSKLDRSIELQNNNNEKEKKSFFWRLSPYRFCKPIGSFQLHQQLH